MSESTDISPQKLKDLRKEHQLKQDDLAKLFGLAKHHISKMESGTRTISSAEQKLLRLYFYGEIPFAGAASSTKLSTVLNFTPEEYELIGRLARREGTTEAKWIAAQIRNCLVFHPTAREEAEKQAAEKDSSPSGLTIIKKDPPELRDKREDSGG